MSAFRHRDLVVLVYLGRSITRVIEAISIGELPKGMIIEGPLGTWAFDGWTHEIGKPNPAVGQGTRLGVLGVFDRNNVEHLNAMVEAVKGVAKF